MYINKAKLDITRIYRAMATAGVDATGDARGSVAALADLNLESPQLAEPKRTEDCAVDYRFQGNIDALEGLPQKRSEDRRKIEMGASDNMGPDRRRPRRERRAKLPNYANRNIAKPAIELNTPRGELIERTDRNLGVKNSANRSDCHARTNSKHANMTNDDNRRALVWQTVGLLGLVLAYLQYYLLDVQLQIAQLPSVVVLLLV
jgi:hypothetical protein